jgi:hypothetical protein
MKKLIAMAILAGTLVLMSGCGGGGGGGGASAPVAPRAKASVVLKNLPRGAAVYVDGTKKTVTNGAVELDAGTHKIQIKKAGYVLNAEGGQINVNLNAGESKEVTVAMTAVAPPVLPGSLARTQ